MSVRRVVAALVAAPVVAAAAGTAALVVSGAHRRLGATEAEARAPLPGDEIVPGADVQNDRARTIAAPPSAVWPWIAQLGQDKAGFYSFETLENLAGCQISGATRIHPEWQDVQPGDRFPLHPEVGLRVAQVDPGRSLVVTSRGGDSPGDMDFQFTWTFHLADATSQTTGQPATRLHIRERYETRDAAARRVIEATAVVSAIMTWRMMSRLASLAAGASG